MTLPQPAPTGQIYTHAPAATNTVPAFAPAPYPPQGQNPQGAPLSKFGRKLIEFLIIYLEYVRIH